MFTPCTVYLVYTAGFQFIKACVVVSRLLEELQSYKRIGTGKDTVSSDSENAFAKHHVFETGWFAQRDRRCRPPVWMV